MPPRIGPFAFGELIEGARTQVQCAIQAGDLPLTLRWLKDGLPVDEVNVASPVLGLSVVQDTYSATLVIPRVAREHAGNYTCAAANAAKTTLMTAPLVVSGNVVGHGAVICRREHRGHGRAKDGGLRSQTFLFIPKTKE